MYSVLIIYAILNSVFSDGNDISSVCCTECSCNIKESTQCILPFRQKCRNGDCILLNFENKSSIVEIEASLELQNNTKSAKSTTGVEMNLNISEFDITENEYVLLETKYFHLNNPDSRSEVYLTRTSNARICVSHWHEWSLYSVKFSFKEIQYHRYKAKVMDSLNASGEILCEYVPNSVSLYQLPKDPDIKWKGIQITIEDLDIDAEKGEYLLIGAGSSEDFPPMFISQITKNSSFYVANASAYIEFVFGSTYRKDKTFKILWNRKGGELPPTLNPVDVLNSVLICFYNYSEAEREFNERGNDEAFPAFREAFSKSAEIYLNIECLEKSSVKLIGQHTEVKSSNALSILLTMSCDGRILKYKELENIITDFEKHDGNKTLGFKIGLCPDVYHQDLPYKEKWSILIYAIVPIFGLLILIIWAWRNNIFSQKFNQDKKGISPYGLTSNSMPVEPNTYEPTIPKVRLDDCQGRRQTLIPGSPQGTERRDSIDGIVTAVEMDAVPSTSRESDSLIRVLTNRKNKRRPSIQSIISKNEDEMFSESDISKIQTEESEHLYDSVSNSKQIGETRL